MEGKMLPKFDYYIDESDPDIVVLRRQDGSFVAAFGAQGATISASAVAATTGLTLTLARSGTNTEELASLRRCYCRCA
jgi:hypothetical protein